MTFDDLPSAWQQGPQDRPMAAEDREAVVASVCRRVERLSGELDRRDLLETAAAVVVILFFGGFLLSSQNLVAKSGAAVIVIWAIFIIVKLYRTRSVQKHSPVDAPVREFCRTEVERLDRQIQLVRSVLWWYIAPCIVAVNLFFVGVAGLGIASVLYCAATLLFAAGIYVLNQRAARKSLVPVRDELANLFADLNEDSQAHPS